ncbi:MAG TPA: hypothetical protein VFF19_02620, partial [Reyranella sp.]|nr:hypothetical protein [Reyranella sp.]
GGLRRTGGEGEAGGEHGERTARDGCHRRYSLNLSDNFASMARHLQSVPACSDHDLALRVRIPRSPVLQ